MKIVPHFAMAPNKSKAFLYGLPSNASEHGKSFWRITLIFKRMTYTVWRSNFQFSRRFDKSAKTFRRRVSANNCKFWRVVAWSNIFWRECIHSKTCFHSLITQRFISGTGRTFAYHSGGPGSILGRSPFTLLQRGDKFVALRCFAVDACSWREAKKVGVCSPLQLKESASQNLTVRSAYPKVQPDQHLTSVADPDLVRDWSDLDLFLPNPVPTLYHIYPKLGHIIKVPQIFIKYFARCG